MRALPTAPYEHYPNTVASGSVLCKTSSRTSARSAGKKKNPSKLMAKELRSKGTLRAQVPVRGRVRRLLVAAHSCASSQPSPLQSPPPSPPPQLTVFVFRRSGFFTDSTWARLSVFTRGEPADASRLWGGLADWQAVAGCSTRAAQPASMQSGACGGPRHAERRLRRASEHGASGAQRACRAAPRRAMLWSAERRRLRRATLHAERRLRRAGAWRAGEPQSAQRDACTGPQQARRAAPAAHGLAGWRAAEGAERRLRRATGTACRVAPAAGYKAHRAALRRVAAGWRAGEPQSAQSAQSGANGGSQRAEWRLRRATACRAAPAAGHTARRAARRRSAVRLRWATAFTERRLRRATARRAAPAAGC